jgi:hypothetical protein
MMFTKELGNFIKFFGIYWGEGGRKNSNRQDTTRLLLILLNTRTRDSHFFGVSHSAVVTIDIVIVLCDVCIEEEEAIEHQAYNTTYQKEMAVLK